MKDKDTILLEMLYENLEKNVIDPGEDNPELYIHPERYIDSEVLPHVLDLWKNKIQTYESGGDSDITETLKGSDTPTPHSWMEWATQNGYVQREYIYKNQLREKSFVIIDKKNLERARSILPSNIEVEVGTGGFEPSEYNSNTPHQNMLIYIQWAKY